MFVRLILSVIIVSLAASHARADEQLVWSDEFDGSAVDLTKWEFQIGDGTATFGFPGWGNNELQHYTSSPQNAFVSGGSLHIVARQEPVGNSQYSSARMRTKGKADFLYGRFEARIKLPSTPGIWPAFWMLPTDSPYGTWAASGEIDIMESVNVADRAYGSIHYGGQWPNNSYSTGERADGTDFSADFHVYSVEWTPQFIRWYIDGTPFYTRVSSNWFSENAPGDNDAPFDVPFHLLLNVAVGGNFPGNPNGASVFPQVMEVDWVRVYQDVPTQAPFGGTPRAIPGRIEMEDFDTGGQDIAYSDCTPANQGNAYRTSEGVDLEACSEGGFNIGWICADEWVEYTVLVMESGTYNLSARVASDQPNGNFHLELDGLAATPDMIVPNTGGWQTWTTINACATLVAGERVLRFANSSGAAEFNVNWIEFVPDCTPGDLNSDGQINGLDVALFAGVIADPGGAGVFSACAADVDQNGALELTDDVSAFVACLLTANCP